MIFHKTKIDGLYIIEPELRIDDRGYYTRLFCKKELLEHGLEFDIMQINRSVTKKKGTIRGIHFQKEPKSEGKIMQCIKGAIYDVAIDLRKGSSTYGQWIGEELTEDNNKILFIPKGFAHGFQTLTDNSLVQYPVSEFYSPEYEDGIRWDDSLFSITWPLKNPILSDKDRCWPDSTLL